MTAAADACFGALQENENDSEAVLNTGTFVDGLVSNLAVFGYRDWDFIAKRDIGGGLSGTDIGLTVTGGSTAGSWGVTAGVLDSYTRLLVVLKATNSFAAYL
jgi:hypothetical protein